MFGALASLLPAIEKQLNIRKTELKSAAEFKSALLKLTGGDAASQRLLVEGEYQGRPAVAILVLK